MCTKNIDWLGLKKELIIAESFNRLLFFLTPYINGNLDLFLKTLVLYLSSIYVDRKRLFINH